MRTLELKPEHVYMIETALYSKREEIKRSCEQKYAYSEFFNSELQVIDEVLTKLQTEDIEND